MANVVLGFIRRVRNPEATVAFYKLLGLHVVRSQQDGEILYFEIGFIHREPIFEVHEARPEYSTDALMVSVKDLSATRLLLEKHGFKVHGTSLEGIGIYVKDPEGMDVLLVEQ